VTDDPGYIHGQRFVRDGVLYTVTDVWMSIARGKPTGSFYVIAHPVGRQYPRRALPIELVRDVLA
jgi:hypothetical protein